MCGIHGIVGSHRDSIAKMIKASHHRGPDANGIYCDDNISLGHNLLAITEDSHLSKQPWVIDDRFVLVYNGEIYNYLDLKEQLKKHFTFKTISDTEVLARGLQLEGEEFLHKLEGMYALAWYDKNNKSLVLARDSYGIKPLYYVNKANKITFSSTIKSLLSVGVDSKIDHMGLELYNHFGYIPGPKTLFNDVTKLYPGQVLKIDLKDNRLLADFHTHKQLKTVNHFNSKDFRNGVSNAVRKCMMGKRPIGLFLSGGMDSSVVLHELCQFCKPRTFTTRFVCRGVESDWNFNDDARVAMQLSKHYKTDHFELLISFDDWIDAREKCIGVLEEPKYNRSVSAYYLMNQAMADQGIVVTLSGDGGDELFTGYGRHNKFANSSLRRNYPHVSKRDIIGEWCWVTRLASNHPCQKNVLDYMEDWTPDVFSDDHVNNCLFLEGINHLPEDYLIRNDQLGMNFSMEARFPLLVDSFRHYALNLFSDSKINPHKKQIKTPSKLAYGGILPKYVIHKRKTGWTVPHSDWFKSSRFRNEFVNPIIDDKYYPPINEVTKNWSNHLKQTINMVHFKMWAKTFGATL